MTEHRPDLPEVPAVEARAAVAELLGAAVSAEYAADAASVLIEHAWATDGDLDPARLVAQAEQRYFMGRDDAWHDVMVDFAPGPIADAVRAELAPRVAALGTTAVDAFEARLPGQTLTMSTQPAAFMSDDALAPAARVRHRVCRRIWRGLVADHVKTLSHSWIGQLVGHARISADNAESVRLAFVAFAELYDPGDRLMLTLIAARREPMKAGTGTPLNEELGAPPIPAEGESITDADEAVLRARFELIHDELEAAIRRARAALQGSGSPYLAVLDCVREDGTVDKQELVALGYPADQDSVTVRAFEALRRHLAADGFLLLDTLSEPLLGSPLRLPEGVRFDTNGLDEPQRSMFERELEGASLREIVTGAAWPWPDPDGDWTQVEVALDLLWDARETVLASILRDCTESKCKNATAAGCCRLRYERGLVRPPVGLPEHLTRPEPGRGRPRASPRAETHNTAAQPGRVVALPPGTLPIEVKAKGPARLRRIVPQLPSPLNKRHSGHWFYFEAKDVHV